MKELLVRDVEQLDRAVEEIIASLSSCRVVAFYGEMGAGKTTLIKKLCHRLGVADTVTSPTFAIVNEYRDQTGNPVYHFDFYRIGNLEEVFDFGYEEYLFGTEGICLIEWPELITELLPESGVLRVEILVNPDWSRTIRLEPLQPDKA